MTQFTVGAVLEDRIARRTLHVEHILAFLTIGSSHGSSSVDVRLWQSVKLLNVIDGHIGVVGLMKEVLAELKLELAEFEVELTKLSLLLIRELGTALYETLVDLLKHLFLLVCKKVFVVFLVLKLDLLILVIYGLDTSEECRIERDIVRVLRQDRREFLLESTHLFGRVRRAERTEDTLYLIEQLTSLVVCCDGVGEGRFLSVVDDGLDLGLMLLKTFEDSLTEMFGSDLLKRSNAIRGGEVGQQWVASFLCLLLAREGQCAHKRQSCDSFVVH